LETRADRGRAEAWYRDVCRLICCTAAAFALLAVPEAAQDKPTLNPNQITMATKRPPLQFDDRRAVIQAALAAENTESVI